MKKLLLATILLANCTLLTAARCGDKIVDTAEETCDDGNKTSGDGCDSSCQTEIVCGNGEIEEGEECEDGNQSNTDACANCQNAECGDGFVQTGVETCDPPDGGECNAQCQLQCDSPDDCLDDNECTTGEDCVNNVCVNTAVDPDDSDQCTADVCDPDLGVINTTQNDGFLCEVGAGRDICLSGVCVLSDCGDGFLDDGNNELCDDGNNTNTDACPNDCTPAVCGDGDVEGAEACDDNNTANNDGCDQNCQTEGVIVDCALDADALSDALAAAVSGDDITVLNGGQCGSQTTVIQIDNKVITVTAAGEEARSSNVLDIGGTSNVSFTNVRFLSQVTVRDTATTLFDDVVFNANIAQSALVITNSAKVGVSQSTFTNPNTNQAARALLCNQSGARFVVDRSAFTGNAGTNVIQLDGCQGIIANSLLHANSSANTIELNSSGKLNVAFSSFLATGAIHGIGIANNNGAILRLDSITGTAVGSDPTLGSASGDVTVASSFIGGEGTDPQLNGQLRISNAAALNQGTDNPPASTTPLFFDPTTIIAGINIFTHDFTNATRPSNNPDPGAFEEP
jgi:cysteine-rich repeat protein